jgi:hypothetical protein
MLISVEVRAYVRIRVGYVPEMTANKIVGKVKLSLCFNWAPRHEGVLGSGGITAHILDLGTRWRWVVSFTPRTLYPQGKSSWYPLDRRLGGPQSRSGEERDSQPLPGLEPLIIQPVALRYTTELSRLLRSPDKPRGVAASLRLNTCRSIWLRSTSQNDVGSSSISIYYTNKTVERWYPWLVITVLPTFCNLWRHPHVVPGRQI